MELAKNLRDLSINNFKNIDFYSPDTNLIKVINSYQNSEEREKKAYILISSKQQKKYYQWELLGIINLEHIIKDNLSEEEVQDKILNQVMKSPVISIYESELDNIFTVIYQLKLSEINALSVINDEGIITGFLTENLVNKWLESQENKLGKQELFTLFNNFSNNLIKEQKIEHYKHLPVLQNKSYLINKLNDKLLTSPLKEKQKVSNHKIIPESEALSWVNEQIFQAVIKNFPLTIAYIDKNLKYRWLKNINTNYDLSFLIGKREDEISDNEDIKKLLKLKEKVFQSGLVQKENISIYWDNNLHNYDIIIEPLADKKGEIIGAIGIYWELTVKQEKEKYSQQLMESAATITGDNVLLKISEYIGKYFDIDYVFIEEKKGEWLETLVFWAEGKFQENICSLLANTPCGQVLEHGFFACQKNIQQSFPHHQVLKELEAEAFIGVPLINIKGNIIGNLAILTKTEISNSKLEIITKILKIFAARITSEIERKQAENELKKSHQKLENEVKKRTAELRESETKFRNLIENFPGAIYSCQCDENWTMKFISEAIEEITGYCARDFVNNQVRTYASVIHPQDSKKVTSIIRKALKNKEKFSLEYRIINKNGNIVWVYEKGQGLFDDQGNLIDIYGGIIDITEKKKAETALKLSEAKYRNLTQIAPVGIFKTDTKGNCIYVNEKCLEIIGRNLENLLNTNWINCLHPQDKMILLKEWEKTLIYHSIFQLEYRFIKPNGDVVWVYGQAIPETDEKGKVISFLGTLTDITEQKIIEQNLALENNFRQQIIENMAEGLCVCHDIETYPYVHFTIWNEAMTKITGYTQEEINKLGWYQTVYQNEEIRKNAEIRMAKMRQGDNLSQEVWEIVAADNTKKTIEITTSLVHKSDGLTYVLGLMKDITEKKEDEIKLKELSKRLKVALKSGDIGTWVWDIINNTLSWDAKMYELYDVSPTEKTIYQTWMNKIHPEDKNRVISHIEGAVRGTNEYNTEFRIVKNDGNYIYIKAYGLLEKNEANQPLKMIGINYDITKQKEGEKLLEYHNQNLTILNEKLAETARLKDEFLANMSHELRTPLNNILGMSEILEEQIYGTLNDRQIKAINTIYRHGQHLLDLINDILDIAKIEAGKMELEIQITSLHNLCQDSLSFISQIAHKKNIHLIKNITSEINWVDLDAKRMRQALINLLSNAVKFTPENGEITLNVTVQNKENSPQKYLNFAVIDTGIGIAPNDINKLFDNFVQLQTGLNKQYQGTGLGLSLVKRIAQLHNGHVFVESSLGKGSCFTVAIPLNNPVDHLKERENYQSLSDDKEPLKLNESHQNPLINNNLEQQQKILILLVEDNESNIATISDYLQVKGYEIMVAKNGLEALETLNNLTPNLMLMDISMPKMDGLETIKLIRKQVNFEHLPIIVTTALANKTDQEKCLEVGANAYFTKPLRLKLLVDKIKELLN